MKESAENGETRTLTARFRTAAQRKAAGAVAEAVGDVHPREVAEALLELDSAERLWCFRHLPAGMKPDVLAELEELGAVDFINALSDTELAEAVEEMAPDDAADVIADLEAPRGSSVLKLMSKEESDEIRQLLRYGPETAGGIMTPDVVSLPADITVAQALQRLGEVETDEPIYNVFVTDSDGRLVGVVRLWDLIRLKDRNATLGEVADRDIVAARVDMDQEEVSRLMLRFDLAAIPVVDHSGRLVGRITADDVMDVLEEEASEDIFRMAGSDDAELTAASPWKASRIRIRWLLITLLTGVVTSMLLKNFINNLSQVLALSFFVPIVMAMGGNTGIQSSTLLVRAIALGLVKGRSIARLLLREIASAVIMGLICGTVIGIWAYYLISRGAISQEYPVLFLAFTVGTAMLCAMTFGALFGALVPLTLHRLKIDPAVASGPFVTSFNDIFALLIYHSVAVSMIVVYKYAYSG